MSARSTLITNEGCFMCDPSNAHGGLSRRHVLIVGAGLHTKAMLISPPDVAIDHLFPPYSLEKNAALRLWFECLARMRARTHAERPRFKKKVIDMSAIKARQSKSVRPMFGDSTAQTEEAAFPRLTYAELAVVKLRLLDVINDSADHGFPSDLLLIGDEPALMSKSLKRVFPAPMHRVQVVRSDRVGLERARTGCPDVIVLDLSLTGRSSVEVYQEIRRIHPRVPVVVVTRASRGDLAIEVMKQGAHDCLFKPLDPSRLRLVVGQALDVARRTRQPDPVEEAGMDADDEGNIVGCCAAMHEVFKAIGRVASQSFPVLITGESGTGKELVARAIYRHGPRSNAPFLALNFAAIPENLFESELFGHERGAFTGADRRRIGKFEQCHGGTIFLDEIGDMHLALQAKVLRLLQEQAFERVGGNETVRTDVRLIAATHRDLKEWAALGKFREDLYYRLAVFTIHLPPLRERVDDLPLMVRYYLRRFSKQLGRDVQDIAPEALERLRCYAWPGNVRELQSVLKQALLKASGSVLLPAFLPEGLTDADTPVCQSPSESNSGMDAFVLRYRVEQNARDLYEAMHRQTDRMLLPRVLRFTQGNIQEGALLLGIARQTLRRKLRELGLAVSPSGEGERRSALARL